MIEVNIAGGGILDDSMKQMIVQIYPQKLVQKVIEEFTKMLNDKLHAIVLILIKEK